MKTFESKKQNAIFYGKQPYEQSKPLKLSKEDIIDPEYVSKLDAHNKGQYEKKVDHFACLKCNNIVSDPRECKSCSKLICYKCISSTDDDGFKIVFSRGSFSESGNKEDFNKIYWSAYDEKLNPTPIIRREAPSATSTHKDIYFKRKTNPKEFDAYEHMLVTWSVQNNEFHKDFDIFSTLDDAMKDQNPW